METRVAKADDYEAVIDLLSVLNPMDSTPDVAAGRNCFHQITNSREFILLVGTLEGRIVTTCYLNVIPNLTRSLSPYAVIENVVTNPLFKRQGLGRKLVLAAVDKARSLGCYKVMLLTGRDADTHTFYEKCGFSKNEKTAFVIRF